MSNTLGSLLLCLLILPSALPQQTKTVDQKLTQLGGWLETWKANSPTLAHQEEQEETLKEVVTAAEGVRAQLEKLLVDIAELVNVTRGQHALELENTDGLKGRQAIAAALSTFQLFIFLTYLAVKIIIYSIKTVKKHNTRRHEEELELMENRLASRKAKRRSAAKHRTGQDSSPPPAPTQQ